jgi:hypothetical protein
MLRSTRLHGADMTSDAWRNRPMTVRTLELCDPCQKLREDVQIREANSYWPKYSLKLRCCAECFATAKRKAAAEATEENYC